MSKRGIAVVVLLIVSVVVMIYKAETSYQHLAAATKWARSFGYGFSPWVIGLTVAAIKEGWSRMRKRTHNFTRSLLWATGVFAVLMVVGAVAASVKDQDREALRDDAMLLMGAGAAVPGVAAYCNKYVEPNQQLLSAAKAWNRRHKAQLQQVIRAIKWAGGLSKDEKDIIDRMAFALLKKEVEAQPDKAGYCREMGQALDQGILDLSRREDTAPALQRIMDFKLR